jgi:hypothetical protein
MEKMKIVLLKDGNMWCCYNEHKFTNLQESDAFWGETPQEALEQFIAFNK